MRRALWLLCLLLFSFGCSQEEATPTPEPLTAAEVLALSAERMQATEGFHFAIDISEGTAYLDADRTLALNEMSGDFTAPDRARAQVKASTPGFVTDLGVISIGDTTWQTNPLTGGWQELPPDFGFNPTVILDPNVGIQTILTEDTVDVTLGEAENLSGRSDAPSLLPLSGTLRGERINQLSSGLIGPQELQFQAWVAPETYELYRVILTDPRPDEQVIWQIDFSDFDEVVTIEAPIEQ